MTSLEVSAYGRFGPEKAISFFLRDIRNVLSIIVGSVDDVT